jgi:hypothetical protein
MLLTGVVPAGTDAELERGGSQTWFFVLLLSKPPNKKKPKEKQTALLGVGSVADPGWKECRIWDLEPERSWARAGAEIRICGSVEPEPKEIFSAPQH